MMKKTTLFLTVALLLVACKEDIDKSARYVFSACSSRCR